MFPETYLQESCDWWKYNSTYYLYNVVHVFSSGSYIFEIFIRDTFTLLNSSVPFSAAEWPKPAYNKNLSYSREVWETLPDKLIMRQLKVTVTQPGFRCKQFYIVTTLLDFKKYPREEIAALYLKRWDVELFFRDIKTTMGFDILRCRSPFMIRKEILMHFIAYNCLRRLMFEAAKDEQLPVKTISFKGSLQAVRNWEPRLGFLGLTMRERQGIITDLYLVVADYKIPSRPGRAEPRCR